MMGRICATITVC